MAASISGVKLNLVPAPPVVNPVVREYVDKTILHLGQEAEWQDQEKLTQFLQKPYLSLFLHRETGYPFLNTEELRQIREDVARFRGVGEEPGCFDSKCGYNTQIALYSLWVVGTVCLLFIPFEEFARDSDSFGWVLVLVSILRIAFTIGSIAVPAIRSLARMKKEAADKQVPPLVYRVGIIVDERRAVLKKLMMELNNDWAHADPLMSRPAHLKAMQYTEPALVAKLQKQDAFRTLMGALMAHFDAARAEQEVADLLPITPPHIFDAKRTARFLLQDIRDTLEGIKSVEGHPPATEMFRHLMDCRKLVEDQYLTRYDDEPDLRRRKKLHGDEGKADGKAPERSVSRGSTSSNLTSARLSGQRSSGLGLPGKQNGHKR